MHSNDGQPMTISADSKWVAGAVDSALLQRRYAQGERDRGRGRSRRPRPHSGRERAYGLPKRYPGAAKNDRASSARARASRAGVDLSRSQLRAHLGIRLLTVRRLARRAARRLPDRVLEHVRRLLRGVPRLLAPRLAVGRAHAGLPRLHPDIAPRSGRALRLLRPGPLLPIAELLRFRRHGISSRLGTFL